MIPKIGLSFSSNSIQTRVDPPKSPLKNEDPEPDDQGFREFHTVNTDTGLIQRVNKLNAPTIPGTHIIDDR